MLFFKRDYVFSIKWLQLLVEIMYLAWLHGVCTWKNVKKHTVNANNFVIYASLIKAIKYNFNFKLKLLLKVKILYYLNYYINKKFLKI